MPASALAQSITFLYTRDLAASAQFYENVLGLTLARDQGDCRIYHLAGEAYLGVCQRDSAPEQTPGVCVTLVTEDVDEWYARLNAQGAAFTQPPTANPQYGLYHCFLRDPNGYLIEIQRFDQPLLAPAETPASLEASEPPTTINLITLSAAGLVKRTPRHLYDRQRRGGMGIFDIDIADEDAPIALMLADVSRALIWLTNYGRAFRVPVSDVPETLVRGKGRALSDLISLMPGERIVTALPERERGNIALLTHSSYARSLPAHIVGPAMRPGTELYKFIDNGHLVSACWTAGNDDLFIATRRGLALRFPEKQLPLAGGPALRLEVGDAPIAIAGVRAEGGVFLVGADGLGTIRRMAGFNANKAPGAGGKQALKTEKLVGAVAVNAGEDIFIISRLSKIIRFRAEEVPAKEGVVQGVHCMALRADETAAVLTSAV